MRREKRPSQGRLEAVLAYPAFEFEPGPRQLCPPNGPRPTAAAFGFSLRFSVVGVVPPPLRRPASVRSSLRALLLRARLPPWAASPLQRRRRDRTAHRGRDELFSSGARRRDARRGPVRGPPRPPVNRHLRRFVAGVCFRRGCVSWLRVVGRARGAN